MKNSNRRYLLLIIVSLTILFISACKEITTTEIPGQQSGRTIFISSNPQNANIFLLGTDTKKVTPDSKINLEPGTIFRLNSITILILLLM